MSAVLHPPDRAEDTGLPNATEERSTYKNLNLNSNHVLREDPELGFLPDLASIAVQLLSDQCTAIPREEPDNRSGFIPELISDSDITFLLQHVSSDSMSEIHALNEITPMHAAWLDSLFTPIPRPSSRHIFRAVEPCLRLAVFSNYYFKGRSRLWHMKQMLQSSSNEPILSLTRDGFRRWLLPLCDRMSQVLELIGTSDISEEALMRCLTVLESALPHRDGSLLRAERRRCTSRFSRLCPLFKALRYTRGADLFASNVYRASTGLGAPADRGLSLLASAGDALDLEDTCNNVMFILSFGHMIWSFEKSLQELLSWINFKLTALDRDMYIVSLQAPSARAAYSRIVSSLLEMLDNRLVEARAFYPLFQHATDVLRHATMDALVLNPEFVRSGILWTCQQKAEPAPPAMGGPTVQTAGNSVIIHMTLPRFVPQQGINWLWKAEHPLRSGNPLNDRSLYAPDFTHTDIQTPTISRPLMFDGPSQPRHDTAGGSSLVASMICIDGAEQLSTEMSHRRDVSADRLFPYILTRGGCWLQRLSSDILRPGRRTRLLRHDPAIAKKKP